MRTLCGTVLALAMAAGPVLAETDSFAGKEERDAFEGRHGLDAAIPKELR